MRMNLRLISAALVVLLAAAADTGIQCRNKYGDAVDWWIAYKYPQATSTNDADQYGSDDGPEIHALYFDSSDDGACESDDETATTTTTKKKAKAKKAKADREVEAEDEYEYNLRQQQEEEAREAKIAAAKAGNGGGGNKPLAIFQPIARSS